MKREFSTNNFDLMVSRMVSSVSMFILVVSSLIFVGLFFYRDFTLLFKDFKKELQQPTPVFTQPTISIPKELPKHVPDTATLPAIDVATPSDQQVIPPSTEDSKEAEKIFVAYELGDTALASRLITDFLVEYPTSTLNNRVLLIGAKIMYDKGDSNGSLNYIQKILKDTLVSNQDYAESILLMGEIARQKKQFDTYIQSFLEQAYFKSEGEIKSKLAFYLGYLFLNKGDYQSSLSYFNNVVGEEGILGRADLYAAQMMRPETINALKNIISQYPNSPNFEYAKDNFLKESYAHAEAVMTRGYFDTAQKVYKEIIEIFPKTAEADQARIKLANIYYDKRQFNEAIKVLGEIIANEDKTNNPEALFMLGKIYFEQGHEDQSLGFFRSILEDYPNSNLVPKAREWQQLLMSSLQG